MKTSYYTPGQIPPAGTATDPQPNGKPIPKVFRPLKLRDVTLPNRMIVSPMCQYSAEDGHLTMWHKAHLGGIFTRGPGLTIIEATAVQANGRITPEDSGLWKDSQIQPLREIVEFAHSQGKKIGIQLGHAGRKASTVAPWLNAGTAAPAEFGGWPDDVMGPTTEPFAAGYPTPRAMTAADISAFKASFVAAVGRAIAAGFDAIEVHAAHGYLLHAFCSPAVNTRADAYGGSFENRVRLLLETAELARGAMPEGMPLLVRISATDWLEEAAGIEGWTLEDSIRLAPLLGERGVDLLDVSTGGAHTLQHPHTGPAYQAPFALKIKEAIGDKMMVTSVGVITEGKQAEELMEKGLDGVMVGRAFLKNPGLLFSWADELDADVQMPNQIRWAFKGRGGKKLKN
ncbi:NADH-dependent flavin oxidoreductase [Lineolata rhizophorae]|uniref:NADH-dependent flavin oxidoreductase n=1 Tax=Lineolata rhizophorae TaxID=578093 RepID=A0A6A6NMY6_9PEZI|nr:NADH-dependent flavin oxidoreductase [Lineolata rhizophorae]